MRDSAKILCNLWDEFYFFEYTKLNRSLNSEIDISRLARAYGLIKTHQQNFPPKIFFSTTETPFSIFDKSLGRIIKKHVPITEFPLKTEFN